MDQGTGKPLQGQIVGLLEVGDVVTVLESDLDFSSAGVPRLHVRDRGGWVSVCAQDGTVSTSDQSSSQLDCRHVWE